MPLLSVITTCKGRLEHLKATLPTLTALPDCQVVVVDYDCPQGAGAWVEANHPTATLVSVRDRRYFNIAEARNLGVAAAVAPWLLLTDADVMAAPDLIEEIRPLLEEGVFLRPGSSDPSLSGTAVVARADFVEIGGYDEAFQGYGSEDIDLMARLQLLGRRTVEFPARLVTSLPHDNAERVRYHEIPDLGVNVLVNSLYRQVMIDLRRQGLNLDLPVRQAIYRDVRQTVRAAADDPGSLEVIFLERDIAWRHLTVSLRYQWR